MSELLPVKSNPSLVKSNLIPVKIGIVVLAGIARETSLNERIKLFRLIVNFIVVPPRFVFNKAIVFLVLVLGPVEPVEKSGDESLVTNFHCG